MYILSTIKCLWIHQIRKKENRRWHRGQRRPTFALPYFGWSRSNTRFSDTFQTLFEVKRTKDTAFNFLSVTVWGTEKIRKKKFGKPKQKIQAAGYSSGRRPTSNKHIFIFGLGKIYNILLSNKFLEIFINYLNLTIEGIVWFFSDTFLGITGWK